MINGSFPLILFQKVSYIFPLDEITKVRKEAGLSLVTPSDEDPAVNVGLLLTKHGIEWCLKYETKIGIPIPVPLAPQSGVLSTDERKRMIMNVDYDGGFQKQKAKGCICDIGLNISNSSVIGSILLLIAKQCWKRAELSNWRVSYYNGALTTVDAMLGDMDLSKMSGGYKLSLVLDEQKQLPKGLTGYLELGSDILRLVELIAR